MKDIGGKWFVETSGENRLPVENIEAKYIDIDWLDLYDNKNYLPGSEITFVVDLDKTIGSKKAPWNAKLTGEDFINQAHVVIARIDAAGNVHQGQVLPAFYPKEDNTQEELKLKELRDKIWQSVKDSKQKSGIFQTNIFSKVTKKYNGRILTSKIKNKPHEALNSGQKLIFGIAVQKGEVITIDAGKEVGEEYSGIEVSKDNLGGIFMLIKGPNGLS